KTVFGLQFLVSGLMEKEKGLYVAIDEKPADVIEQAASLGWDLAPFIESKEFLILDASAYFNARASDGQSRCSLPGTPWRACSTRRACFFTACRPPPTRPIC